MLSKEELLIAITGAAETQVVTETEVITAYRAGAAPTTTPHKRVGVTEVLYAIGGLIIFVGIIVLISQNWEQLPSVTRIVATLGTSLAAYVMGVLFWRYPNLQGAARAIWVISALVAPIGLAVTFHEAGMDVGTAYVQTLLSGCLLLVYGASLVVFRHHLFTFFAVIFGTWFFFSATNQLIGAQPHFDEAKFYEYRTLWVGLSYLLLGYALAQKKVPTLPSFLYTSGIVGFLGAALALGGWIPQQNAFWEIIFPGLAMGTIFLSITVKSRIFLVWGAIYLVAYILKITAEYFSDTLGWPLALVVVGFMLIGVGYGTLYLNRKYMRVPARQT